MRLFKKKSRRYVAPKTFSIKKCNLPKATTSYSSRNNRFVGYEVGAGKYKKRFSSSAPSEAYSKKLLKMNKGLSGSGLERGVMSKPLYYGNKL